MTTEESIDIGVSIDEAEMRAFRHLADYAFSPNPTPTADIEWMLRQGAENYRFARVRGRLAGGLGMIPMGQWFGGRRVPMVGINAVVVAPEHRSTGLASKLLRVMLEDARHSGFAISALYPATQPVYRRTGYEQAGIAMSYQQPLYALSPRDRGLEVRPAEEGDHTVLRELYSEHARRTAGNLDRNEYMWGRVLESPQDIVKNMYLVERDGRPEGYIVYTQVQEPGQQEKNIVAHDLVALTPEAGTAARLPCGSPLNGEHCGVDYQLENLPLGLKRRIFQRPAYVLAELIDTQCSQR